ncbi:MAG: alpha-amylase [Halanaerobiaceae bacterium]
MKNQTIMQVFYWELNTGEYEKKFPEEANLWNLLKKRAEEIASIGITSVWIPPANKGLEAENDVGYGCYDLWDLGEFIQKGTKRTKYGTREELEEAITAFHKEGIKIYYDAVLNHLMGADETEKVKLSRNSMDAPGEEVIVWTKFNYPNRNKYSNFQWNWSHFNGTDWTENLGSGLYLFEGKRWDDTYQWLDDFLLGVDYDYLNPEVQDEIIKWGKWLVNEINIDGFRLDAVRHIDINFMNKWIEELQKYTDIWLDFIGEIWFDEPEDIAGYLNTVNNDHLLAFDYPLQNSFRKLRDGNLDMRWFGGEGLVNKKDYEQKAVTFVDNHDTDRDNGGYGIKSIFKRKYQAYTYILTREEGLPTIFWKDYYVYGMKDKLDKIIKARKKFAYGPGFETSTNDFNTYSYIRAGSDKNPGSGLVMMITQETGGEIITKTINSRQSETTYYDYTGNIKQKVKTDVRGFGEFKVHGSEEKGWSIWVPE